MFKKFKALFSTPPRSAPAPVNCAPAAPAEHALAAEIAKRSKTDPLAGAKIGSRELSERLLEAMKDERGVHVESVLCVLGALAGYACQNAVRAQALAKGLRADGLFTTARSADGKAFYFGDHLNRPLAESPYSVWSIAAAGAQEAGCTTLPDVAAIFMHVSDDIGSATFGVPRVPDKHQARDAPLNYLRMWPAVTPILSKFCPDPALWPVMVALSIQQILVMSKDAIDPGIALTIAMEAAIPMSKVELPPS